MLNLKLEVVTPQRTLVTTRADWLTLPGSEGEMGILPAHIPLLTTLQPGALIYQNEGVRHAIAIHWGYAQVDNDHIVVLAELAELAPEIDLARAQAAEKKARDVLNGPFNHGDPQEVQRLRKYEAKLKRALVRQTVAQYK